MKIGCCAPFPCYEMVSNAGFDFIELKGIEVCGCTEEEYEEALVHLKNGSIPCSCINGYCNDSVPLVGPMYKRTRASQYALKLSQRADRLGAGLIGVGAPFARNIPQGFSRDQAVEQFKEAMFDLAEISNSYGITCVLEPLSSPMCNFITKTEEAFDLVEEIGHKNLGLMYDFFHSYRMGEDPFSLKKEIGKAKHIHISGISPNRRTYPVYEEKNVLEQWNEALIASGYEGNLSVEIGHSHDMESLIICQKLVREVFVDRKL